MKEHIRTFIAIKIDPEKLLLEQFRTFKKLFKEERINWVPEDNFHLTLRFIGNTTREQLYELVDRLEVVAAHQEKFNFTIVGAGYFKSKGNPRVLFIKINAEQPLTTLSEKVEQAVVATGFYPELKPFRPHLTLGRIKNLDNRLRFTTMIDDLPAKEYQHVKVSEFILYQSILSSDGPIYKVIQKFELK